MYATHQCLPLSRRAQAQQQTNRYDLLAESNGSFAWHPHLHKLSVSKKRRKERKEKKQDEDIGTYRTVRYAKTNKNKKSQAGKTGINRSSERENACSYLSTAAFIAAPNSGHGSGMVVSGSTPAGNGLHNSTPRRIPLPRTSRMQPRSLKLSSFARK